MQNHETTMQSHENTMCGGDINIALSHRTFVISYHFIVPFPPSAEGRYYDKMTQKCETMMRRHEKMMREGNTNIALSNRHFPFPMNRSKWCDNDGPNGYMMLVKIPDFTWHYCQWGGMLYFWKEHGQWIERLQKCAGFFTYDIWIHISTTFKVSAQNISFFIMFLV